MRYRFCRKLLVGVVPALLLFACSDGGGTEETPDVLQDLVGDVGGDDIAGGDALFDVPGELPDEEVEPQDPCNPNPCTELPAAACDSDGITLLTYEEGVCTAEDGDAVCDYPALPVDCSADGMVCQDAACVEQADPCDPNPCTQAPAAECDEDGLTLLTYAAPGDCTDVDGSPECAYQSTSTNCADDGLVCVDGECADLCDPNPCTQPPADECEDDATLLVYPVEGTCAIDGLDATCEYVPETIDCTQTQEVCLDGVCVPEGFGNMPAEAGQVVITEFMAKSQGGSDKGEWVELYNPTEQAFDLMGCMLTDLGSDSHEFATNLIVPAGGYVVLARSDVPEENHGLVPDYVYSGTALANSSDEIILTCGEVTIDEVIYDASVVVEGAAAQLAPEQLDAVANDDLANWCIAAETYGTADKMGTPGEANPECVLPDLCDPNPCTEPPAPACDDDGVTVLAYEALGECATVDGEAVCTYIEANVDCGATDQVCFEGACIDPEDPCDPNPCADAPVDACDADGITLLTYSAPGDCTAEEGLPVCDYPATPVDCSADGMVCFNAACVPEGAGNQPAEAGQVIVTEFMARSQSGTDNGEWVELHNLTGETFDLGGCILGDAENDAHTIEGVLILAPGEYLVLARSDVAEENHGLTFDYVYSGFQMSNTADEIILTCNDLVIDQVVYDDSWVELGVARQLKDDSFDALLNDDPLNWCSANVVYGTADKLGTPGDANTECSAPDPCDPNPCDQPPPLACDADGVTLHDFELPGVCTNVDGEAQCAYIPQDTDCSEKGGICQDGMCVSADPCDPNPCTEPPAATCDVDGVTLLTYEAPGACTDNGGVAECEYTQVPKSCADLDQICENGACVADNGAEPPAAAGDLVITEFMARSQSGADLGEWVELYNTTDKLLDLQGCILRDDDSDNVTIDAEVLVPAGEYVVLARSSVAEENHGLPAPAFVYGGGFQMANSSDEIALDCGATVIDHLAYTADWVELGAAIQLSSAATSDVENDDLANWCLATTEYGTAAKLGTPGAANAECPKPFVVDWCRYQHPTATTELPGAAFATYGRLYIAGLTDLTTGNDTDELVVGQAGVGADGTDPAVDGSWQWFDATPTPGWDGSTALPEAEPDNDEYTADVTASDVEGAYDLAFRFSGDGGETWVYCDTDAGAGADGSENGYQTDNAGALTVSSE